MDRADAASGCAVLASVTTPAQAKTALERGATGVVMSAVYVTSPEAVMRAVDLAQEREVIWVDVRALQAAMAGIPAGQVLTAEIDPASYDLLKGVAAVPERRPGCRIGMRLSGPVSDDVAARLYGLGFRLFAVDPEELRVVRLALGKAAWK
jgi:pyruvate,orthophosphate dikinase